MEIVVDDGTQSSADRPGSLGGIVSVIRLCLRKDQEYFGLTECRTSCEHDVLPCQAVGFALVRSIES